MRLNAFNKTVVNLFKMKAANMKSSRILNEQMNELLPLLMNGQVSVKEQTMKWYEVVGLIASVLSIISAFFAILSWIKSRKNKNNKHIKSRK